MDLHVHIISKAKAKELGMKRYFTGKPCKRGGVGERRVSGCRCRCALCIEAVTENQRNYYEKNREIILEVNRKYRHENRDSVLEAQRNYYEKNRDSVLEANRNYHKKNREYIIEAKRGYYEEYYKDNREKIREGGRKYYRKNKHIYAANLARYRAAKMHRTLVIDCELTQLVEREAYSLAAERKEQTGFDWHVDHMLPMQGDDVSGFHHWRNLQVIPAALNLSKHNRMIYTEPFEWLKDA